MPAWSHIRARRRGSGPVQQPHIAPSQKCKPPWGFRIRVSQLRLGAGTRNSLNLRPRLAFSVQHRLLDGDGKILPHDGFTGDTVFVRGPTVAGRYLGHDEHEAVERLDTGDIA